MFKQTHLPSTLPSRSSVSLRLSLGTAVDIYLEQGYYLDRENPEISFKFGSVIKSVSIEDNEVFQSRFDPIPFCKEKWSWASSRAIKGDDLEELTSIFSLLADSDCSLEQPRRSIPRLEFNRSTEKLRKCYLGDWSRPFEKESESCANATASVLSLAIEAAEAYRQDQPVSPVIRNVFEDYKPADNVVFLVANKFFLWELIATPAYFIEPGKEMDFLGKHLNPLSFPGCKLNRARKDLDYVNQIIFFPLKLLDTIQNHSAFGSFPMYW